MCKTAVFYGEALAKYGFGGSHPFGTDRLDAFWKKLQTESIGNIAPEEPVMASYQDLVLFHDSSYIELVKVASKHGGVSLDRGDTPAFKGAFEASLYVVGSTLAALDMVVEGKDKKGRKVDHAFNPIGGLHHARRDSAGGFCIFNDIGVAIQVAREKYRLERIAYIDIDAHHGDGVFYEFEDDPLTFVADIHEDGRYLYPGTGSSTEIGKDAAVNTKLNIPLEPGASDLDFIQAFGKIEHFVDNVKPQLIILQCGADGIAGDPITHLQYTSKAHMYAANSIHMLAHEHCKGRLIALGGGGYNRANIGTAWTEVVRSLAGGVTLE
ncbi:MAG: acetoin utilization protein AcuC [Thermoproteota archaeon]|nr:acetoin utilization protein AcuC [Thermoproteota archaeon]